MVPDVKVGRLPVAMELLVKRAPQRGHISLSSANPPANLLSQTNEQTMRAEQLASYRQVSDVSTSMVVATGKYCTLHLHKSSAI